MPSLRIVSGGQTGVDRAALDVAAEIGFESGGWCPKGRIAEDGALPARYPLQETPARRYAQRTEWNVRDSDATLILAHGSLTGGTALTVRFASELARPFLVVDLAAGEDASGEETRAWLAKNAVRTLNVAGPRESTAPGIYEAARAFLLRLLLVLLAFVLGGPFAARAAAATPEAKPTLEGPAIVVDANADGMAQDGARDFRVYWYRMTGALLPIVPATKDLASAGVPGGSFVLGRLDVNPVVEALQEQGKLGLGGATLGPEGFKLETIPSASGTVTVVAASTGRGVMYGGYELLERYGVRFFTERDTVPDLRGKVPRLELDEIEEPRLAVRGSLPWSNFIASPYVWDLADYYRYIDQMAKQKFNLLMFHVYKEEPYLRFTHRETSHPVRRGNASAGRWHEKTGIEQMPLGLQRFYRAPVFGSEALVDAKTDSEAFERASAMLRRMMAYAHRRGIQVCMGFEVGLHPPEIRAVVPKEAWLDEQHLLDPTGAPAREILEIQIRNLVETYPDVDYVAFWQPESVFRFQLPEGKSEGFDRFVRTHEAKFSYELERAKKPHERKRAEQRIRMNLWTAAYFLRAISILKKVAPEKVPVIAGWGGSMGYSGQLVGALEGLDAILPKNVVLSYLTGLYGLMNVAPVLGEIQGRPKWPISWFEGDYALWYPSYNVHLMDRQLESGARRGVTGFIGIHWRTQNIERSASYVARKLWSDGWTPETFYRDYARTELGDEALAEALTRLDKETRFVGSPEWSGYKEGQPMGAVSDRHREALNETLAFLEGRTVPGALEQERLELLRNEMRATKTLDEIGQTMRRVYPSKKQKIEPQELEQARRAALPELRRERMREALEQSANRTFVKEHLGLLIGLSGGHARLREVTAQIEKETGSPARPEDAKPRDVRIVPHTFLWARSPVYEKGKPAVVEAIVATAEPVQAVLRYRKIGEKEFASVPMEQGWETSFRGMLPESALQGDVVEYFVEVSSPDGRVLPELRYPRSVETVWMEPL